VCGSDGNPAVAEELKVKAYYNERSLFSRGFLLGFLGLGRATAFTVLPLRLQFFEVFGTAPRDLPPALSSKSDGGGILLFRQS
jgi:hypothetical protein